MFPLVCLIFLKRSLVFPFLLFSSISLHWSLRKSFLFLHAILWNSAFKWAYLSFSPLPFTSLLFSAICKVYSDTHLAFLYFFSLGMVLIPASCTMSHTSIHNSSGTLSIRSNPLNLFVTSTKYNRKGFDLGHTWIWMWQEVVIPESECGKKFMVWVQSAPRLIFSDCTELLPRHAAAAPVPTIFPKSFSIHT